MARICTLFSGSSGNASFVAGETGGIVIDAGVSCKRMTEALKSLHIAPDEVRGILVTHEHSDHISGLTVFLKKTGADLYASEAVLSHLISQNCIPAGIRTIPVSPGCSFEIDGVEVKGFPISHDSVGALGYRMTMPDGRVAAYATDMGEADDTAVQSLTGADLVVIEANYDPLMLAGGSYPYVLKKRIMSKYGHLSNLECSKLAAKLVASGTTRLMLAHLSKENNTPEIAYEAVNAGLNREGMVLGVDYTLTVAPRNCPGNMVIY